MSTFNQTIASILQQFINPDIRSQSQSLLQFKLINLFANVNFQEQAKDDLGNLHPQYMEPIKKGYKVMDDYVQLYSNDILNTIRQIDFLCIKTAGRNQQKYEQCKTQMNEQIHKKIFVPFVNASALLYKVSNQCLLKGNSIQICSNMITDHTYFMFKLAAERAKLLTYPLQKQVPIELQPLRFEKIKLNNAVTN